MIVDTSAVVALVQGERPHATLVAAALAGAHSPVMSAPTVAECLIVLTARHGPVARTIFERLRSEIGLSVSSFTAEPRNEPFCDTARGATARLSTSETV